MIFTYNYESQILKLWCLKLKQNVFLFSMNISRDSINRKMIIAKFKNMC